jgi:hypothetical protein
MAVTENDPPCPSVREILTGCELMTGEVAAEFVVTLTLEDSSEFE